MKILMAGSGQNISVIRKAQKYARDRLENKWLPMYMETPEFKQRHFASKLDNDKKKVQENTACALYHAATLTY